MVYSLYQLYKKYFIKMNDNNNVNQKKIKYPTDEIYHKFYSTKYIDRVKNTTHCREKNIVKTVLVLPMDVTILGFNILNAIAMNLAYIVA